MPCCACRYYTVEQLDESNEASHNAVHGAFRIVYVGSGMLTAGVTHVRREQA